MKKLQTKTTWSFAFSCPSVSLLAFPPPFFLSSYWLPMEITLDLVSQHSIEIGWMAALRWCRHTSNEKIDVVDWLVLGLQIIYIFLGDASLLQIFEAVYHRRNFTKRVSICCAWRHTTCLEFWLAPTPSRPLWMFRDTRSDKSPGPRNMFSCIDLEKSLGKNQTNPRINRVPINIVYWVLIILLIIDIKSDIFNDWIYCFNNKYFLSVTW